MWRFALLLVAMSAGACSESRSDVPSDGGTGSRKDARPAPTTPAPSAVPSIPPVTHTYAPTYEAVWREILLPSCAWEFCHGGSGLSLDLESKALGYETMVNFPAGGADCKDTGLVHVLPGQPEKSLLYLKITNPPCGKRMPLLYGTTGQLDPREVEQIRSWIERGAPDDSVADAAIGVEASASSDSGRDQ